MCSSDLYIADQKAVREINNYKKTAQIRFASKEAYLNEKITDLEKEVKKSQDKTISLTQLLDEEQDRSRLLENQKARSDNNLKNRIGEITDLNKKISSLEKELQAVKTQTAGKIRSAQKPLNKTITELSNQIVLLKEKHESDNNLLKQQYQAKLEVVHKESEARLDSERMGMEAKLAAKEGYLKEKIVGLEKDLAGLTGSSEGQIRSLTKELKEKEIKLSSLDKEKDRLDRSLGLNNKKLIGLERKVLKLEEELTKSRTKAGDRIRSARAPLNKTISELKVQLASLEQESEDDQTLLEQQYEAKLNAVRKEYESKSKGQARVIQARAAAKATYWKEKIVNLESRLTAQEREYQAKLIDLEKKYEDQIAEQRQTAQAELESGRDRLKEKIAALERELKAGKKEYETKLSSHQMVTETSYTAKETQLRRKIDLLEKDLAGFKKEADQETLSLTQRLSQKTEDLSLLEKREHNLNNDLDKSDKELARAYERSEERRVGKECRSRWSP